jgi:outer membrane protein
MNKKGWIAIGIIFLSFIVFFIYTNTTKRKIVYVKLGNLYDDFEMKKELEATYLNVQKARKEQLDSLELELKLLNNTLDAQGEKKELVQVFEIKKENYLLKKKQFSEDDALMQQQYSDKIRKQLNQYVTDYGKENKCDYIFGAEGSGVLMYAKEDDDRTAEVLIYVNNKFKGVK